MIVIIFAPQISCSSHYSHDTNLTNKDINNDLNFNEKYENKYLNKLQICSLGYQAVNNYLKVSFKETHSKDWHFQYIPGEWGDACYLEHFGVYTDAWGATEVSDGNFTVDERFEESSDGRTATLSYDDLEVIRQICVPAGDASYFTISYVLTNTNKNRPLNDVRFFEIVDYDIVGLEGDYGWYIESADSVWENDREYFRNGFWGNKPSSGHGMEYYSFELSEDWIDGVLNNLDKYPETGTDDVAVGMEWDVGDLSPGEYWDITITFWFGESGGIYADSGPEQVVSKGQPVLLNASRSASIGGEIISYEWDLDNDGTYDVNVDSPVYVYDGWSEIGVHTVGLQVTNDLGNRGTDKTKINVISPFDINISAPRTNTSIGGVLTYHLELINHQNVADLFDLDVKGVRNSWVSMDDSCHLKAGDSKIIPLKISVPKGSSNKGEYSVLVKAKSSNLGTSEEISVSLNVYKNPLIFDLIPANNTRTGSDDVLFNWDTSVDSTSEVFIKSEGESRYSLIRGDECVNHAVLANNLTRNTLYEFYVKSKSTYGETKSDVRQIFVDNGITFNKRNYEFYIERDYNQHCLISVKNTDTEAHDLLVRAVNPYDDLYLGFVGEGSADKTISLDPGDTRDIELVIHAQDAMSEDYQLIINLTNIGTENITDHALLHVGVKQPNIDFEIDEVGTDPITQTKTLKITNRGDPLTDLSLILDENLKTKVIIQPSLSHSYLGTGESTEISVSPIWSEGIDSVEGKVTATVADQSRELDLDYSCSGDKRLYEITLDHPILYFDLKGAYCINAHHVEDAFSLPPGLDAEDVLYANIGMEMDAKGGQARPYNVWVKINGNPVGTLRNIFPRGHYEFEIDPNYFNYATAGTASNQYTLDSDIPGSYYTPLTNVRVVMCVDGLKLYICAENEEQAEEIAWSTPYIHKPSDSIIVNILSPLDGSALNPDRSALIKAEVIGDYGGEKLCRVAASFSNGDGDLVLVDNGLHGDGRADDGVYACNWNPGNVGDCDIKVSACNCAATGSDRISVEVVEPKITISPDSWDSGYVWRGEVIEQSFSIRSTADSDVTVYSVTAPDWVTLDGFTTGTIPPGSTTYFTATLDTAKIGVCSGDIIVTSNDPVEPIIRIPVSAVVQDNGVLLAASQLRDEFEQTVNTVTDYNADMVAWSVERGGEGIIYVATGSIFDHITTLPKVDVAYNWWMEFFEGLKTLICFLEDESIGKDRSHNFAKDWYMNDNGPFPSGQDYIDWSNAQLDHFSNALHTNSIEVDETKAKHYIRKHKMMISNKVEKAPIMLLLAEYGNPNVNWMGIVPVIRIPFGPATILTTSFKSNYDAAKLVYDLGDIVGYVALVGAIIIIVLIVVHSFGTALPFVAELLAVVGKAKAASALALIAFTICGSMTGCLLLAATYDHNLRMPLDNILSGEIPTMINDPEGPYISEFNIENISIGGEGSIQITFVYAGPDSTHATPLVMVKSLDGDLLSEILGNETRQVDSGESESFDLTFMGSIPGTYYASSMVIYNETLVTPPVTKSFRIYNIDNTIGDVTRNKEIYSIGEPVNVTTNIQNAMNADHDMTLWVRLLSPDGSLIAYDNKEVSSTIGLQSINSSISTENVTVDGIYKIEAILFDIIYPVSEYTSSVIIGNKSSEYEGALIKDIDIKEGYDPEELVTFDVDITNSGNIVLHDINVTCVLMGPQLETTLTNSTLIEQIATGSASTLKFDLLHQQTLVPDLYALEVIITNQNGSVLDRSATTTMVIGNGTLIPVTTIEREVYRQGEPVNITVDLMDEFGFYISNVTVTAEVLDPSQAEIAKLVLAPEDAGLYTANLTHLNQSGTYTVKICASKKGYRCFDDVTHFLMSYPSKLDCDISISKTRYSLNESIPFNLNITSNDLPIDTSLIAKITLPDNSTYTIPTYKDSKGNYSGTIRNTELAGLYNFSVETRKVFYDNTVISTEVEVGPAVLFDGSHGEIFSVEPNAKYSYSKFVSGLENNGYVSKTLNSSPITKARKLPSSCSSSSNKAFRYR